MITLQQQYDEWVKTASRLEAIETKLNAGIGVADASVKAELDQIKAKLNGTLSTQLTGSIVKDDMMQVRGKSEILVFSKNSPLPPRTAADYEPRSATTQTHWFPHLWTPTNQAPYKFKDYRDIFDQSFVISSTLDKNITVVFRVSESSTPDVIRDIIVIQAGIIQASNGSTQKTMILAPEKGTSDSNVVEIPELRQPYPSFQIVFVISEAPTVGEIKILNTRRY